MAISDEDIRRVREASEITAVFGERVPLRQRGRDFWCNCPIHDEKTPSCKIDSSTQLWHCFGCGAGGDVFSFVMQLDGLGFLDAVRKLADRSGIIIEESAGSVRSRGKKTRLMEVCREAAVFFHEQLMRGKGEGAASARKYLGERGFGGELPRKWQLGYAPGGGMLVKHLRAKGFSESELVEANVAVKNAYRSARDRFFERIIFPICDSQGECIAFGGRVVFSGEPKYLNSQETPLFHKSSVLYALDKAKASLTATGVAVVVEGYTDVIALHEAGITNVVATLGTALTGQHIRILSRHAKNKIVYLFDGDEAGLRAADRALGLIDESITPEVGKRSIELEVVVLPDGADPADFVQAQGKEALVALIDEAIPLIQHGIDRRLGSYDLKRTGERVRAMQDALSILAPIKDSLLAKEYAIKIAGSIPGAREEDALEQLARLNPPRRLGEEGVTVPSVGGSGSSPDARAAASSSAAGRRRLDEGQKSRLRFEREFLSLCARYPSIGLASSAALAQTEWQDPVHARLAEALLEVLSRDARIAAADLVCRVRQKLPLAERILTSGEMGTGDAQAGSPPEALAGFLAEELAIGDIEDNIATFQTRLKNPSGLDPQEFEALFESVVALQKDLDFRRKNHRLP